MRKKIINVLKCRLIYRKIRRLESKCSIKIVREKLDRTKALFIFMDESTKIQTIGEIEGELIALAFEYAKEYRLPVITYVSSAGMRINEGVVALMQMAKMTVAIEEHNNCGLLYISVISKDTLGGTSASLVSLADIVIAKRTAKFGFTGKKIILETIPKNLPVDFQSAEYSQRYGMVDIVADDSEIEGILSVLLKS